jgi:hypothetical protein
MAEPAPPLERPRPAVTLGTPLAGALRSAPVLELFGLLEYTVGGKGRSEPEHYYVAEIESEVLVRTTFLPLENLPRSSLVRARTLDGYQREPGLRRPSELAALLVEHPGCPLPAPVVNARGRWRARHESDGTVTVHGFDAAAVVTGQDVILALAKAWHDREFSRPVTFLLALDLPFDAERALYEARAVADEPTHDVQTRRYPLKVTTDELELEVLCEPFVTYTRRGYAPMVDVKDLTTGKEHSLYVQAASLALPLERIREQRGRLTGVRIAVAKESAAPTAKYSVGEII